MSGWLAELLKGAVHEAAPRLLGHHLVSEVGGVRTAIRLSEVEAYGGTDDPASHAYRRQTERNSAMFGPAGTAYVYRSYGIHWCLNVVTGSAGHPSAVLVRAGVPVAGTDVMIGRRGRTDHLTDGPGKLCQALGVTGVLDGVALTAGVLRLEPGEPAPAYEATPRIGISRGVDRRWRFVVRD